MYKLFKNNSTTLIKNRPKMLIVFQFTHQLRATGESTTVLPVVFLTSYWYSCKLCKPVKIREKKHPEWQLH